MHNRCADVENILLTEGQIQERVRELGRRISEDHSESQPVMIGVLNGAVCFFADLIREVSLPVEVDFLCPSRVGWGVHSEIGIVKDVGLDITERDVILVEDIVDTGVTLDYLLKHLWAKEPSNIEVCALLDKRVKRVVEVPIKYVGFEVPDRFVVGYGLDYEERFRNLRFIGTVTTEK